MFGQKSQPNKHTGPVIMKDRFGKLLWPFLISSNTILGF